jgi:hypothetical protein
VFEIGRSLFGPTKLHLGEAVRLLGQASFDAYTDFFVRENFSTLDLSEPLLDLAQKPLVVLNRTFNGFEH